LIEKRSKINSEVSSCVRKQSQINTQYQLGGEDFIVLAEKSQPISVRKAHSSIHEQREAHA
jgi:hypothetical protein